MSEADSVLVVDDVSSLRDVMVGMLTMGGLRATAVESAEAALSALDGQSFDLVLSDVKMPGLDGLGLLRELKLRMPEVPVVLLTGEGTVAMAVEAMRTGAADFLLKGADNDEVLRVVRKELQASRSGREAPPRIACSPEPSVDGLVGSSPALTEARELIRKMAPSMATVLIRGEMGTGKELAARALHTLSPRAKGPFIKVNCAALPEGLFESELFGTEPGAFPGAVRKPGRVALAEGGTLFLDEIGELSPLVQPKLLRLLQESEYEKLGGTKTLKANVRVVAATNRNLEQMGTEKTFRADLFHRLKGMTLVLPPLREHAADIVPLAKHFVAALGAANGRPTSTLSPAALAQLQAQEWTGNVRELQNFIERLVVLSEGPLLSEADVRRELARDQITAVKVIVSTAESLPERRREVERAAVQEALEKAGGNCTLAARLLDVSRRTFYNKMRELGVRPYRAGKPAASPV
jgi:two-component system, NtrC family, response regulator AtoC